MMIYHYHLQVQKNNIIKVIFNKNLSKYNYMNNFKTIISNQWVQISILLFLFWFLFLRETFTNTNTNLPIEVESCKRCNKIIFNENSKIDIITFKNKCFGLDGIYIKDNNNIRSCENYKSTLDSNYRCNCEIN